MTSTTNFDHALEVVRRHTYTYPIIKFPIEVSTDPADKPGTFIPAVGPKFRMLMTGATYMAERNPRLYSHRPFAQMFRAGDWHGLAALGNKAMANRYRPNQSKRLESDPMIAALFDNHLVGILRQYNPIRHEDILEDIKTAGLATDVTAFKLLETHFWVDLNAKVYPTSFYDAEGNTRDMTIGMRVSNGHSGHHALRYSMFIRLTDFETNRPLQARARHLSGVTEASQNMAALMKQVGEFRLDEYLKAINPATLCQKIRRQIGTNLTEKHMIIFKAIEHAPVYNGLDAVMLISQFGAKHGWSGTVTSMLDPLIQSIQF